MLAPRLEAAELDEQHENLVLSAECQLVTVVAVVPGLLEVTTQHVYFYDGSAERVETEEGVFCWSGLEGRQGWGLGSRGAGAGSSSTCSPSLQASAMTSGAHWPSCARSTCGVSTCAAQLLSSSSLIRPTTSSTSHARRAGPQPHPLPPCPGPSPPSFHPTPRCGTRCTPGSCVCDPQPKAT